MSLLRPMLYAAGSLAGVYLVDQARPVDARAAVNVGVGALDRFALSALEEAGGAAAAAIKGQVRANIITGVLAGCAAAAVVDAMLLKG